MKNKLIDLNDHLFAQLERLGNEDLNKEQLAHEVSRSKAITAVSGQIVDNARLALDAERYVATCMTVNQRLPAMLESKNG